LASPPASDADEFAPSCTPGFDRLGNATLHISGSNAVPLSAGGLALMMLLGVATRIRVLDSLAQTLPALVLMCVNLFIAWYALGRATPA
jgi:hypothetical protein